MSATGSVGGTARREPHAPEATLGRKADYLHADSTLRSWFLTTDHKRIAILYAITITIFFFLAGAAVTVIRLELFTPYGRLVSNDTYNKLFSFHGINSRPMPRITRSKISASSRLIRIPTTTSSRMPRCLPFWNR